MTHADGHQTEYDKLESAMRFAEHRLIVTRAAGLLSSCTDAASGWATSLEQTAANSDVQALQACCAPATRPHAACVRKGLHRRDHDPHRRLQGKVKVKVKVKEVDSERKRQFRLSVTVSRTALGLVSGNEEKFVWAPAQFAWQGETYAHCWPAGVATTSRTRGNRMSLSAPMARADEIADIRAHDAFGKLLSAAKPGSLTKQDKRQRYGDKEVQRQVARSPAGPQQRKTGQPLLEADPSF